ncbi:hypothetical protein PROFUN_01158 [Planoprotostelium fungivorum]|uniref:DH domain-containing protein n=1 Tax=Planoprotostelium fungivorum TaxID=1890364 RepID=A0A2P6NCF8_9EUKA|nr:hypothetical protein PROFUN_01158 [Planoprotostelium fungivorum]
MGNVGSSSEAEGIFEESDIPESEIDSAERLKRSNSMTEGLLDGKEGEKTMTKWTKKYYQRRRAAKQKQLEQEKGKSDTGRRPTLSIGSSAEPVHSLTLSEKEKEDLKSLEKTFQKRRENLNEILGTEERYVKQLQTCAQVWLEPLRREHILEEQHIRTIFSIIEVILHLHLDLLDQLSRRLINVTPRTINNKDELAAYNVASTTLGAEIYPFASIADIFKARGDFLKMYITYVNNFNAALTCIAINKEKDERFAHFLKVQIHHPESNNLDLLSFLITPIQRLPRYILLLEDLIKNTPQDHADYVPLTLAVEKIRGIADHVNEEKRVSENIQQIMKIQDELAGDFENIVEPHRRLKRTEKFTWLNSPTFRSMVSPSKSVTDEVFDDIEDNRLAAPSPTRDVATLTCWVFNDLIILATPTRQSWTGPIAKRYNLKAYSHILLTEVRDMPDITNQKNRFEIVTENNKSFVVSMTSGDAKENFIKDFYWERSKANNLLAFSAADANAPVHELREKERKRIESKRQLEKQDLVSSTISNEGSPLITPLRSARYSGAFKEKDSENIRVEPQRSCCSIV